MGHIGMLPQSVLLEGGYSIKGKTPETSDTLLADALALADAGVFAMVLELVHPAAAETKLAPAAQLAHDTPVPP